MARRAAIFVSLYDSRKEVNNMNQRLKRWESPRNEGRNDKGKGGSARQRQKRKQFQMLRKKLKGEGASAFSLFLVENLI